VIAQHLVESAAVWYAIRPMHHVFRRQEREEECPDHHKRNNDGDSEDDGLEAAHRSCGPAARLADLTTLVVGGGNRDNRRAVPSSFITSLRQLGAKGRSARSRTNRTP
jgi:hypothetical protein